jgi:hypothetical protein
MTVIGQKNSLYLSPRNRSYLNELDWHIITLMKRNLFTVVSGIILVGIGLLAGCGKPAASGGKTLVSAEKNSFHQVTSQLDAGGELYLYLSTEQLLDGISGKVAGWRDAIAAMPGLDAEKQGQVRKGFDVVTALIKDSGIEDVSGFGMSSVAVEGGVYHSKAFLHHYPNRGSGFLWNLFGERQHALDGLDLLPAQTAAASFCDLDLKLAWSTLQKHVRQSGFPQAVDFLNQVPTKFEEATGLKWDKALGSLGGEYGVVLTLDNSRLIPIPLPTSEPLELPEPGLMIVIKVKDETLFNRIEEALNQTGQRIVSVDKPGLKMRTVPFPLPLPVQLRPTLAASEGYLFIATSDALVQEALAVRSGQKPGLKSTDEFKRLSNNMPQQGNEFTFLSRRFGEALVRIQRQAMELGGKLAPAQQRWLRSLMQPDRVAFSYSVSANTAEGWLTVGNGNQHPAKILLIPAAATAGMISAIALPNFVRARDTAQKNACLNNLRQLDAAKAQWALENSKTSQDVPTEAEIASYLNNKRMPACPGGGHYTLGPLSERPRCSIPGHQLPD